MLHYTLTTHLTRTDDSFSSGSQQPCTKVMTLEEFTEFYQDTETFSIMSRNLTHIHYCKADALGSCVTGTFAVPHKEAPSSARLCFSFCLTDTELLFVDEQNTVSSILAELEEKPLTKEASPLHFLFDFLEYLIKDDVFFLQHFEEKLTGMEEHLLDGKDEHFDREILHIRRELAVLGAYYEQLTAMGASLQEAFPDQRKDRGRVLFSLYTDRAERLNSSVQMLKEYSMQLREMHQAQIDVRQNQIMKVLTIVTTLFMPLTLITGWYGMNFINMPELSSPYGYGIVILISLLLIVVELWVFHKKNWFD